MDIKLTDFKNLSQDDNLGNVGEYLYGENLDTETNTEYFSLGRVPQSFLKNLSSPVSCIQGVNQLQYRGVVSCLQDGKIYFDKDLKYTHTSKILKVVDGPLCIFFIDEGTRVYKVSKNDLTLSSWSASNFTRTDPDTLVSEGGWRVDPISTPNVSITKLSSSFIMGFDYTLVEFSIIDGEIMTILPGAGTNQLYFSSPIVHLFAKSDLEVYAVLADGRIQLWNKENLTLDDSTAIGNNVDMAVSNAGGFYFTHGDNLYSFAESSNLLHSSFYSDALGKEKFKIRDGKNSSSLLLSDKKIFIAGAKSDSVKYKDYDLGDAVVYSYGYDNNKNYPGLKVEAAKNYEGKKMIRIYGLADLSIKEELVDDTEDVNTKKLIYFAYRSAEGMYGIDYIDLTEKNYITAKEGVFILNSMTFNDIESFNLDLKELKAISTMIDWGNVESGYVEFFGIRDGEFFNIEQLHNNLKNTAKVRLTPSRGSATGGLLLQKIEGINRTFGNITIGIYIKIEDTKVIRRKDTIKIYGFSLDIGTNDNANS